MIIVLILAMTVSGSLGAFFLKKSVEGDFRVAVLLRSPFLYLGGGFYVLGALLNIVLLRYLDYSVVYPLTALTYVWTLPISAMFLGERITARKGAGVALILLGVFLLTR